MLDKRRNGLGISCEYKSHEHAAPVKVPFQSNKSLVSAKSQMGAGCVEVTEPRFSGWSKTQATDCEKAAAQHVSEKSSRILVVVLDDRVEAHSLVTQRARGSSARSWPMPDPRRRG